MVLYVIHGWTYTTKPWAKTIALLKEKGVNIKMLNVPGLTAPSQKVWTIDEYVKWADQNIPDGAIALGHSNGGRILLNLCDQKPDKLKHLILLDSAGVYEESTKRNLMRHLSKTLAPLKKVPYLQKVVHKLTGASDYSKAPENMKQTLANMIDSDKNLDLTKVTTPTSILWGRADTVTPPRQASVIHRAISGSTLKLFNSWTHAPYISHPQELASAILATLKEGKK
ncbi:alpha/beta hydrolase [Candidatus Saccharibacteria bacterium]|nr:alpha/beta hydrolase [Candidatus Saccharibacteria bacterium]